MSRNANFVMSHELETSLRGPIAFALARQALDEMEARGIWPTPLNYELWLHTLDQPESELAREIKQLLDSGDTLNDAIANELAQRFLPRFQLNEELADAGKMLSKELRQVTDAINQARISQANYGKTLEGASMHLDTLDATRLKVLLTSLATATRRMFEENSHLEKRLEDSSNEVSRLRQHLDQMRKDAMTDALTNLANRKSFDEQLERALSSSSTAPLTLALIDIDHFKKFNDTWGHQTGDQVIRYVASVLARVGQAPRVAARYGGEEFGLLFPGETANHVEALLNEVREEISSRVLKRRSTNEDLGAVTISAGVAQREGPEDAITLMERADKALYLSKNHGRNIVTNAERYRSQSDAA